MGANSASERQCGEILHRGTDTRNLPELTQSNILPFTFLMGPLLYVIVTMAFWCGSWIQQLTFTTFCTPPANIVNVWSIKQGHERLYGFILAQMSSHVNYNDPWNRSLLAL